MPVAKTSQSRGGWGCTGNQCRIKNALAKGLMDGGADVIDIGMVGTEEVYFATRFYGVDGGIQVTASHNPIDYNGMKLVKKDAQPISGDNGLYEIQRLAQDNHLRHLASGASLKPSWSANTMSSTY